MDDKTRHIKPGREQAKQEAEYAFPYHYIARRTEGNFSQTYNLSWGFEYLSYIQFVIDKLTHLQFGSLLDVGCGDGRFLYEVRKVFSHVYLAGIDISERAVGFARILNPDVHYMMGDLADKNITGKKFDVITAIEVLEHIAPEKLPVFLEGLHFSLEIKGMLFLTVPSKNVRVRSKHYQHFDIAHLQEILNPYFEIAGRYFLNRIGFRRNVLKTCLSNRLFLLNSEFLLNAIYNYYQNAMLNAHEHDSQRIFLICRKQ
jgi:2-polyprenyl-3-methyl-5-hydroxy-6-metoxy-1,4-benzoquinol methylase